MTTAAPRGWLLIQGLSSSFGCIRHLLGQRAIVTTNAGDNGAQQRDGFEGELEYLESHEVSFLWGPLSAGLTPEAPPIGGSGHS